MIRKLVSRAEVRPGSLVLAPSEAPTATSLRIPVPWLAWVDIVVSGAAIGLGLLVRLPYLDRSNFPLNDGGLFYLMTQELQRSRFALPSFTSYNAAHIPYAYPPLSFYLAGLLSSGLHIDLLTLYRDLPLFANLITIVAVYFLARTLLGSGAVAAVAALIFAVLPTGFIWLIMGGGLPRSLGLLFSVLAIQQFCLLCRRPDRSLAVKVGALSALTILSHPEMAYCLGISALVLLLLWRCNWQTVRAAGTSAVLATIVTAPWWFTVIRLHGTSPLVSAVGTGGGILPGLLVMFAFAFRTQEAFFPVLSALALLGMLACWQRPKERCLIVWPVALLAFDPRSGANFAAVPVALLAAIALTRVLPGIIAGETLGSPARDSRTETRPAPGRPAVALLVVLGLVLCYAALSALATAPRTLSSLSRDDRLAMTWVAENTPPSGRFLVITGHGALSDRLALGEDAVSSWADDRASEWFPVLAQRVSVATVQGHEWLGDAPRLEREYASVQRCALEDVACVARWASTTGTKFDYVYIVGGDDWSLPDTESTGDSSAPSTCCPLLRDSLARDPDYRLVYAGRSASVFVRSTTGSSGSTH